MQIDFTGLNFVETCEKDTSYEYNASSTVATTTEISVCYNSATATTLIFGIVFLFILGVVSLIYFINKKKIINANS